MMMAETEGYSFLPDYAVHPGETLEEELAAAGMQRAELAERLGVACATVDGIIEGRMRVTRELAAGLEGVFNLPAHVWSNLQRYFEGHRGRLALERRHI